MTADYGSVEPVDASELTAEHDDIEHWLHGLRTELTDNPSDWLDTAGPADDAPVLDYATAPGEARAPRDAAAPAEDGGPAFAPTEDGGPAFAPAGDGGPAFVPAPEVRVGRHRAED